MDPLLHQGRRFGAAGNFVGYCTAVDIAAEVVAEVAAEIGRSVGRCIGFADLRVGRGRCSFLAAGKGQRSECSLVKENEKAYHCVDFLHDSVLGSLNGVSRSY